MEKDKTANEKHSPSWLENAFRDIRLNHIGSKSDSSKVVETLDTFLEHFRTYFRKNPPDKSKRMTDINFIRGTKQLMFVLNDLVQEENEEFLMKLSEMLGGVTALWLRHCPSENEQYTESDMKHTLSLINQYLESANNEWFLLKVLMNVVFANKELPQFVLKALEKHLKLCKRPTDRSDQEVKGDQLYIMYIIAFKLLEDIRPENVIEIEDIPKFANDFMKPCKSILSNRRYAPYLPAITGKDVDEGKATRIILSNIPREFIIRLAEAVVKEDWLYGCNIQKPITVDLSEEDEESKDECEISEIDSMGVDVECLSLEDSDIEDQIVFEEHAWIEILQNRSQYKKIKQENPCYNLIEIIDLDDEESSSDDDNDNDKDKEKDSKDDDDDEDDDVGDEDDELSVASSFEIDKHSIKLVCKGLINDNERTALGQIEINDIMEIANTSLTETRLEDKNKPEEQGRQKETEAMAEVPVESSEKEQVIDMEISTVTEITEEHVKEGIEECTQENKANKTSTEDIDKSTEGQMDIEVEPRNVQTSKDSGELFSTSKESNELHVEDTESNKSTLKNLTPDSEPGTSQSAISSILQVNNTPASNSCTDDETVEVLKIYPKCITLDIQSNFNNKLDMEEEMEKRINEMALTEGNNVDLQDDVSDDDKPVSIISIEDTMSKSPTLLSDGYERETESTESAEAITIEEDENVDIENSLNNKVSEISAQTTEIIEDNTDNNKSCSNFSRKSESDNELPNDLSKDDLSKINSDKENERNISSPEILEDEASMPHSTDDDDHMSISSIIEESETYDNNDGKIDDIHIDKINSHEIDEATMSSEKSSSEVSVLFSVTTGKKLSPLSEYPDNFPEEIDQNDRVVFSTSTANVRQNRCASPSYGFSPFSERYYSSSPADVEEITSPPVESFSKLDTDEFRKLFNKPYTEADKNAKTESSTENVDPVIDGQANQPENLVSNRTHKVIPKRSILSKTDGNIQSENISSSTKRKAVSFATISQEKRPLILNRDLDLDSTILERKSYVSPITVQTDPQIWRPPLINTTPISNQHEQPKPSNEQDQDLEILSTGEINSFGSPSPPLIKDSGRENAGSLINTVPSKSGLNKVFLSKGDHTNTYGKISHCEDKSFLEADHKTKVKETKGVTNGNIPLLQRKNLLKIDVIPVDLDYPLPNVKNPFVRQVNISTSTKPQSAVLKQNSAKPPYDGMSDFDRYLAERRISFTESYRYFSNNNSNCAPENNMNKIKNDPKMNHSFVKLYRNDTNTDNGKKPQNRLLSDRDINLLNSFNDPKLKKRILIKLNKHKNVETEKLNKSPQKPLTPQVTNNRIEKNHRDRESDTPQLELNQINTNENLDVIRNERTSIKPTMFSHENLQNAKTVANKKSLPVTFWSFTNNKNSNNFSRAENGIAMSSKLISKNNNTDKTGSNTIVVKNRRSSLNSLVVVRMFFEKNKIFLPSRILRPKQGDTFKQPIVLVKRIRKDILSKYMPNNKCESKKRNNNQKRDQSKRKSKSRKASEFEEFLEKRKRINSKSISRRFSENQQIKYINDESNTSNRNRGRSKSISEANKELSEADFSYPSNKRRPQSRAKTTSPSPKNMKKSNDELHKNPTLTPYKKRATYRPKSRSKSKPVISVDDIKEEDATSKSPEKIYFDLIEEERHLANNSAPAIYIQDANDAGSINLCIRDQKNSYGIDATRYHTPDIFKNLVDSSELYADEYESYTLPLDLSMKTYSPPADKNSLKNPFECNRFYGSSTSYYRFELEMKSESGEDETSDEFSSQLHYNTLSSQYSSPECPTESESPLVLLSNPNEGVFMSDVLDVYENSQFSRNNSQCCSSDTSDLVILPNRCEILDNMNFNESICDENGHTHAYTTGNDKGSVIRRHYTHKRGENIQKNTSENRLVVNRRNSIDSSNSGSESPECTFNTNIVIRTYSKNNLVKKVFVPPELEMNFEDSSKLSLIQYIRKGLSNSSVV